ncbi:Di-copper centre-containing protein [Hypoxylon trugodes]|uniref:Di-copper centre-containing protein n=1 Tax=Hypoxylon trugodes TaxID=326681 RepID=UPI00218E8363|nr:Di-copper centre-containing protein [Hypoxylon trugodes]KAI1391954.1 Di-copper centre-containing protein [Hypoxylon trugodes]
MKASAVLFASAVSAASIPSVPQIQGLPLSQFGGVHAISIEDAINKLDLLGTNFSALPISFDGEPLFSLAEEKATASTASTNAAADTGDCANPNVRYEWDHYSASDKQAFVDAIQCLINKPPSGNFSPSKNRYEDFVRLHQSYSPNIHSKSTSQQTHKFLLWHRYYVWALEQVMRDECGFNRAFPWWDEKKWAGKFSQATIFTNQYFGNLPGATNGAATCINSGRFSGMQLSLGPGMTTNNPHCLQRAVNEQTTAQTGIDSWNTCMSRTSYPDFHSCVEFTFHAQGHNGMGGIMADAIASPGDPAFFMHHLFVDYAFRKWQIDDVSRRTTISGCADNVNCSPLTLDTMVYMGNICGAKCPDLKVRDILNTLQGHLCYRYDY